MHFFIVFSVIVAELGLDSRWLSRGGVHKSEIAASDDGELEQNSMWLIVALSLRVGGVVLLWLYAGEIICCVVRTD